MSLKPDLSQIEKNPKFEDFIVAPINLESPTIQDDLMEHFEMVQYPVPECEGAPSANSFYSHQVNTARILSNTTGNTGFIVLHKAGSGKTRTLANYIEQVLGDPMESQMVYVILGNESQKVVINNEISKSNPQKYGVVTGGSIETKRISNMINRVYHVRTKFEFRKEMHKAKKDGDTDKYRGAIIWIDEVQGLAIKRDILKIIKGTTEIEVEAPRGKNKSQDKKSLYEYSALLQAAKYGARIIMTSYTPASVPEYIDSVVMLARPNITIPDKYDWAEDRNNYFRGIVSVIDTLDAKIQVKEQGREIGEGLVKRKIYETEMSDYQADIFLAAINRTNNRSGSGITVKEKKDSLELSLSIGVFPEYDGEEDYEGRNKSERDQIWFNVQNSKPDLVTFSDKFLEILNEDLIREKRKLPIGRDSEFKAKINVIRKYSSIYASIIEINNQPKFSKCATVSIDNIQGEGTNMFVSFLRWMGYEAFTGKDKRGKVITDYSNLPKKKRFALLTGGGSKSETNIKSKINLQQHPENYKGEYLEIFIFTSVGRSGFSFFNVGRQFDIFTSYVLTSQMQTDARIVRANAYEETIRKMKLEGKTGPIVVDRYRMTSYTKKGGKYENRFERVYELAFQKQSELDKIYDKMKKEAVDVKINRNRVTFETGYKRNANEGKDVSRYIARHMKEDANNYLSKIIGELRYKDTYDLGEDDLDQVFIEYIIREIDSKVTWIINRFGMDAFLLTSGYTVYSQVGWGGNSQYCPEVRFAVKKSIDLTLEPDMVDYLTGKYTRKFDSFSGTQKMSMAERCIIEIAGEIGIESSVNVNPDIRDNILGLMKNLWFKFERRDFTAFEHKRHKRSKIEREKRSNMEISTFMKRWNKLEVESGFVYINIFKFLESPPDGVPRLRTPVDMIRILIPDYGWRDTTLEESWFYEHLLTDRMIKIVSEFGENTSAIQFDQKVWIIRHDPYGKTKALTGGLASSFSVTKLLQLLYYIEGREYDMKKTRNILGGKAGQHKYSMGELSFIPKGDDPNDYPVDFIKFGLERREIPNGIQKETLIRNITDTLQSEGLLYKVY